MEKKDFRKLYEELVKSDWFKKAYHDKNLGECPFEIPELAESEDERIRKEIVGVIQRHYPNTPESYRWIAYLEKQKDLDKMIVVSPEVWDNAISDAYENGKEDSEKQKEQKPWKVGANAYFTPEQKPEPVFKIGDKIRLKSEPKYPYREIVDIRNGAYYFDEAVYLLFDNQDNWEKEQKEIPLMGGDTDTYFDDLRITTKPLTSREWFDEGIKYAQRLQKEQKPAEIDEYEIIKKHITHDSLSSEVNKRLKECGWYVTEEPVKWGEEDQKSLNRAINICISDFGEDCQTAKFLKSLPKRFNLQSMQEWSEEDEKDMAHIIRILDDCYDYGKHDLSKTDHENLINTLKSLCPHWKPSEHQMTILKAVKDYVGVGSGYWGEALGTLIEDLEKL